MLLLTERLSVAVRSRVESYCHFCTSFWILVSLPFSSRCWCTSSSSSLFVLRRPGDSLMDLLLSGCESYLLLHADKTRSCSFCFTAKLPELCTLHVNLTLSSCLRIHSSDAWSPSDPGEGRKMGGDAGGRGDVDAQLETCCFPTESKLFASVARRFHFLVL